MAVEYTETFDTILQDTLPDLPGAIRSVAKRELRLTLREFFEKSYAWTKVVPSIAVPTGVGSVVQIDDGDANTEVIAVLSVAIGEGSNFRYLTPMPGAPISEVTTSNEPTYWYCTSNPDEIAVYPYPENALTKTLKVTVALIPAFDTENLPRQVTLKYHDAIMDGFLARMHAQPTKPYSDSMKAAQLRHNFLRACGYYASQRKKGYNNSPNWKFPPGWKIK
jgi:hypothetical protein